MVKCSLQIIVFHVCREHILGVINLLSSLTSMWVSCHPCLIVWGFVAKKALLGLVVKLTCSLE